MRKGNKKLQAITACLMAGCVFLSGMAFGEEAAEDLFLSEETEITTESAQILAEETEEVVTKGLRFASDYKEVYEALNSAQRRYYDYEVLDGMYALEESASMDTGSARVESNAKQAAAAMDTAAPDYSSTNLRDDQVDEADIVKTDGRYIYVLKDGRELLIVKADGADSTYVSRTDLTEKDDGSYRVTMHAEDMYVDGDTLVVILSKSERTDSDDWAYTWKDSVVACTYDIADRSAPVSKGSVWQDGAYKQSRKVGDHVYIYSTQYIDLYDMTYEESLKRITPVVNGEDIEPGKICIPEYVTNSAYLIVSSVSTAEPDRVIDSKVMVSGAETMYVTTGSLYVMNQSWSGSQERTEIVRFAFEDGRIEGKAAARVKGYLNDSFSIDEYQGNLRVLTTYMGSDTGALLEALSDLFGLGYYADDHWVRHNSLYILDENLQRRARLYDIAENEEIRSARFFGDTVYFVTFRNTDPLFTADLSDPDHPQLTGELKISGFSSYLHPYGDGLLLGIGYEADEFTGSTTGLKLSMFDISDPTDVKECGRFVMDGITWCPAIDDYKAILANGKKNLIGFFCDNRYMAFTYDRESGFERVLLYDFYEDMLNGNVSYDTMRGLYIDDEMYLAGADFVVGFDMKGSTGFEKNLVLQP